MLKDTVRRRLISIFKISNINIYICVYINIVKKKNLKEINPLHIQRLKPKSITEDAS